MASVNQGDEHLQLRVYKNEEHAEDEPPQAQVTSKTTQETRTKPTEPRIVSVHGLLEKVSSSATSKGVAKQD